MDHTENLQYGLQSTLWVLGKDVTPTEVCTTSHPRHERSTHSVTLSNWPANKTNAALTVKCQRFAVTWRLRTGWRRS